MLGGKPDAYVTVSYTSCYGSSVLRTTAVEGDCNPEWHEDMVFREKVPTEEISRQFTEDRDVTITLNDSSASSMMDGDPFVASTTLKVKQVFENPGEFTLKLPGKGKETCTIFIKARFEASKAKPLGAVGSDWLNGILRKGKKV